MSKFGGTNNNWLGTFPFDVLLLLKGINDSVTTLSTLLSTWVNDYEETLWEDKNNPGNVYIRKVKVDTSGNYTVEWRDIAGAIVSPNIWDLVPVEGKQWEVMRGRYRAKVTSDPYYIAGDILEIIYFVNSDENQTWSFYLLNITNGNIYYNPAIFMADLEPVEKYYHEPLVDTSPMMIGSSTITGSGNIPAAGYRAVMVTNPKTNTAAIILNGVPLEPGFSKRYEAIYNRTLPTISYDTGGQTAYVEYIQ